MSHSDRFHRAARDGFLDLLHNANKKDLNTPDEDGMTPTLLASACGKLDALRLIVGRGGDPDKCDWYGSTALHCAAANDHINCVSFLVSFGANIWALDNEHHTPKHVAGIKNNDEILRFLDAEMTKQLKLNKKNVSSMQEKAVRDADKRLKAFQKLQAKAEKRAAKEEKLMQKEREKMGENFEVDNRRGSTVGIPNNIRRDSRALYASPKYSDLVHSGTSSKKPLSGVSKKIQQQKAKSPTTPTAPGDFKVRDFENDGNRSVRSLTGLRRDSEVLYVTKFDSVDAGSVDSGFRKSTRDLYDNNGYDENTTGMFERPGFGNVAFRSNSLTGAMMSSLSMDFGTGGVKKRPSLNGLGISSEGDEENGELGSAGEGSAGDSIGSAGSLAKRNRKPKWSDYYDNVDDDDVPGVSSVSALETFLTAHDLMSCFEYLRREEIDLKALLLLNETDLKEIRIPMGSRKKMMEAINRRKDILNDAGEVYDSRI
ncbi:hypothetical protein CHUAL_007594 [Chamberlinius hualienensis]